MKFDAEDSCLMRVFWMMNFAKVCKAESARH